MFEILKRRSVLILLGVILTIVVLIIIGFKIKTKPVPVTLNFWGAYDDKEAFQTIINDFRKINPLVQIKYKLIDYSDYENQLIEAFATGNGPDIFMIHNNWLPKYQNKIKPLLDSKTYPLVTYKDSFVDVVWNDFVRDDKIYAFPFYVDTLALYYNRDLFNKAGIAEPPKSWNDFIKDVELLTKKDIDGSIIQAGAALGTSRNINRSTDILSLLMMQEGGKIFDTKTNKFIFDREDSGKHALTFYTDFSNSKKQVYTWNSNMHYSIDAFYEEQVAMIFNYSHHIKTIKSRAPYLNYRIAKMPQIDPQAGKIVNYANYWGGAVWNGSKNSDIAWKFLQFLTKPENLKTYLSITKRPTPRKDMIASQKLDLELGVFAEQALSANSYYQPDPIIVETVFADMIDAVIFGKLDIDEALKKAADQLNATIR